MIWSQGLDTLVSLVRQWKIQFPRRRISKFKPEFGNPGVAAHQSLVTRQGGAALATEQMLLRLLPAGKVARRSLKLSKGAMHFAELFLAQVAADCTQRNDTKKRLATTSLKSMASLGGASGADCLYNAGQWVASSRGQLFRFGRHRAHCRILSAVLALDLTR